MSAPPRTDAVLPYLIRWSALASLCGVLAGASSALFLVALDWATATREARPWLVWLLPLGGLLIGLLYHHAGKKAEAGTNLLLDEIHEPRGMVPARMAPLILFTTVGTHLVGGSAGREGTAVQMGGGLAGTLARLLGLRGHDARLLLMAGMSGGFGAVFGTPLAGAVFGMEVLAVGRLRHDALFPCLLAGLVGDWTCTAFGVQHTHFPAIPARAASPLLARQVVLASLAFAAAAAAFIELSHAIQRVFKAIPWPPARPLVGGLLLLGLLGLAGTRDYLGLGVPMIVRSFDPGGVPWLAFAWKIGFTALTLGSGFKGGEVTPLFFIGATLGHALGHLLGADPAFMAALGLVAVFAGCANTPLACTVMGMELFGAGAGPWLALACCLTYLGTGRRGIYAAQRVGVAKGASGEAVSPDGGGEAGDVGRLPPDAAPSGTPDRVR